MPLILDYKRTPLGHVDHNDSLHGMQSGIMLVHKRLLHRSKLAASKHVALQASQQGRVLATQVGCCCCSWLLPAGWAPWHPWRKAVVSLLLMGDALHSTVQS